MTKRQLIDEIITNNHTASPGFLAQFSDEDLIEYLTHLKWLRQPRLSGDSRRFEKYFRSLSRPHVTVTAEPAPSSRSHAPAAEKRCEEKPADTPAAATLPTIGPTENPHKIDDQAIEDAPASGEELDGVYMDELADDIQEDPCYQSESPQEPDCDSELEQARQTDYDKAEQARQAALRRQSYGASTTDSSEGESQSWLF